LFLSVREPVPDLAHGVKIPEFVATDEPESMSKVDSPGEIPG
jgi:hypothetical protein